MADFLGLRLLLYIKVNSLTFFRFDHLSNESRESQWYINIILERFWRVFCFISYKLYCIFLSWIWFAFELMFYKGCNTVAFYTDCSLHLVITSFTFSWTGKISINNEGLLPRGNGLYYDVRYYWSEIIWWYP